MKVCEHTKTATRKPQKNKEVAENILDATFIVHAIIKKRN